METQRAAPASIDAYIAACPAELQPVLQALRAAIHAAAPDATEKISYQMPTFYLHGNLVHFALFKNHIGFFPTPSGIEAYKRELAAYTGTKGSIHFPIGQPLPLKLIAKIVKFRAKENVERAKAKARARQ